jgi:tRNA uridine 5-carboxymethylaminomethyl modification enzyme
LVDLLGRPNVTIDNLTPHIKALKSETDKIVERKEEILEAAEIRIKYKGYIERENMVAEKMLRLENIKIKGKFDYMNMNQITIEARQKLAAINPETLAQASRIPGVSPCDINVMLVLLGR